MLLAVDTATRILSLALHTGDTLLAERAWTTAHNHTIELSPAIDDLLTTAAVTVDDLTALAVTTGPGSFTGLRIGMSVTKGIALAHDPVLPLVGVPTLEVTAAGQAPIANRLLAVSQAGRGRINGCYFDWQSDHWQTDGDPFLADWPTTIQTLTGDILIAGEITTEARATLQSSDKLIYLASPAQSLRRAAHLAELAYIRLSEQPIHDAASLAPTYLHT